jgi:hypothetical protein
LTKMKKRDTNIGRLPSRSHVADSAPISRRRLESWIPTTSISGPSRSVATSRRARPGRSRPPQRSPSTRASRRTVSPYTSCRRAGSPAGATGSFTASPAAHISTSAADAGVGIFPHPGLEQSG